MMSRVIHGAGQQRTFAAILETGDEVMSCLLGLAGAEGIAGAAVNGIGAFSAATLAYFDWDEKRYVSKAFEEQLEVASLAGDIGVDEKGKPAVHIHLVLGRRNFDALAGHLVSGSVRPTLELIVTETPSHLRRHKDPETGLALIRL